MTAPVNNTFTPALSFAGIITPSQFLETRMVNSVSGQIEYVGFSPIQNANEANPIWYILKFYYDTNGFLNRQQLPKNGPGFIYIWNDMSSYFL